MIAPIAPGRLATALALALVVAGRTGLAQEVRVERDVAVPMRDGVVLRADVYRPAQDGPLPVLVSRTPYGKRGIHPEAYVTAGYIVVCQDVRGRYASDGTFESFLRVRTHDAEDGYDTVEWAARLAGSTGKVGTFGGSYDAFLQWRLAALRPPALVAMAAESIPARYTDLEGPGTIRPGRRLAWWRTMMSPELRRRAGRPGPQTPAEARALWNAGEGQNWLAFLPWLDLPDDLFEDEGPAVREWLRHPSTDPWKLDEGCARIEVPNLDVVGWFDHANGDMLLFRTMVRSGATDAARRGQRIVIGPWTHASRGHVSESIDFGPEANVDLVALRIRWFDYWLKGKANGVDADAPVRVFVMGANRWRDEREWPLGRARPLDWFLDGSGKANGPSGDGRLVSQAPAHRAEDHYRYDPRNPVPSLHGPELFTLSTDQRPLAPRPDILVYQTPPLDAGIEITGNPEVELFAASSAPDTDFFARLIDVAPDGVARDVALGIVRARFRRSREHPEWLTPGAVTRFVIRMNPTSNVFLPGHRIRLDATSSDFPNYDRNHNTDRDPNADPTLAVAEQTIVHGGAHASKLTLPWIPANEAARGLQTP
jgi:putative CocE/NonD family hydrolase